MDKLENKYRKDELSPQELLELRHKVNSMTDSEIEQQMHEDWIFNEIDTSHVDDQQMKRVKSNIDKAIRRNPVVLSLFIRWGQIAAALLLPISMAWSIYLYHENNVLLSEEMIVSTARGERASITLPDGTIVSLNSESKLIYRTKDYNKKERKITFDGEGYFQVHKDKEVPFVITAKGLQVKVLGTIFNLSVREKNNTAELALLDGSVEILSIKTNKDVILQPNQRAILNQLTGDVTVLKENNMQYMSAWRFGDLVFHNTNLSHVLQSIEDNYAVVVTVNCANCLDDTFTGTLPLTNLNEALEVLEKSYNMKVKMVNNEIHLEE